MLIGDSWGCSFVYVPLCGHIEGRMTGDTHKEQVMSSSSSASPCLSLNILFQAGMTDSG